jgi:hypothetical protein
MENVETLFHYRVGDLVLRRRKVLGKIAPRAEGPYKIIKIGGAMR